MSLRPLVLLRQNYNTLSSSQKRIANYLLQNTDKIDELTISLLANACSITTTTVMRFIKKLGYTSYRTFRLDLIKELIGGTELAAKEGYEDINTGDDMELIMQKVVHSASSTIQDLPQMLNTRLLEKAVDILYNARNILFFGAGGSGLIAEDAYQRFLRLGINGFCDSNTYFSIVRSIRMEPSDVLLLISHKGESREVLECARNAKENGGKIIAITSYRQSTLAQMADISLFSSSYSSPHYTDAMISRLIQLTILDMLFISVSLRMGKQSSFEIAQSWKALKAYRKQGSDAAG